MYLARMLMKFYLKRRFLTIFQFLFDLKHENDFAHSNNKKTGITTKYFSQFFFFLISFCFFGTNAALTQHENGM